MCTGTLLSAHFFQQCFFQLECTSFQRRVCFSQRQPEVASFSLSFLSVGYISFQLAGFSWTYLCEVISVPVPILLACPCSFIFGFVPVLLAGPCSFIFFCPCSFRESLFKHHLWWNNHMNTRVSLGMVMLPQAWDQDLSSSLGAASCRVTWPFLNALGWLKLSHGDLTGVPCWDLTSRTLEGKLWQILNAFGKKEKHLCSSEGMPILCVCPSLILFFLLFFSYDFYCVASFRKTSPQLLLKVSSTIRLSNHASS